MVDQSVFQGVLAAIRATDRTDIPAEIGPEDSLVDDLGFDSMGIVTLGMTLEEQFGFSILLDEWIGGHIEPGRMTVRSLCNFIGEKVGREVVAVHG